MAGETELALFALAALALGGKKKPAASDGAPAAPVQRDAGDQTGADLKKGFEVGLGVIGLGGSVVTALGGVSLGGGGAAAAAGAAKGAAAAAAPASASSSTSALSVAWTTVLGPLTAIVIVSAWLVSIGAIALGMAQAAGRRAARAQKGRKGVEDDYNARLAQQTEWATEELLYQYGVANNCTPGYQRTFNNGLQWGPGWGFYEIIPGTVYGVDGPAGTAAAIYSLARFLAVEQLRGHNDTVLNYMTIEAGFQETHVELNGDALTRAHFDELIAGWYAANPVLYGQYVGNFDGSPQTWAQVSTIVQATAGAQQRVAVARFSGKQSGYAYVNAALALLYFQTPGIQPIDQGAAAICKPPTSDQLAWLNRVYGFGATIQAGIFYQDDAQVAWAPALSQPGKPFMYPYGTKGLLTSWEVGRW